MWKTTEESGNIHNKGERKWTHTKIILKEGMESSENACHRIMHTHRNPDGWLLTDDNCDDVDNDGSTAQNVGL
jgi:hypothetical protein